MAKIARCTGCGHLMPEVWKEKERCERCQGQISHLNENVGFIESLPRLMNAGGIALVVFATLYLAYRVLSDDLGRGESVSVMVLLAVGMVMFLASLLFQIRVGRVAVGKYSEREGRRPARRLKGRSAVREGSIDGEVRRATKLPLRER